MELLFLIFVLVVYLCICFIKCKKIDERRAHQDLPNVRESLSQRRARRRQGQEPSAPQDPEQQRAERTELVKSTLFSRKLAEGDNVGSMKSILSAAKERYDDDGNSKRGNMISRSWRAASSSTRTLTRNECTICLDQYEEGETVCWAKKDECDHIFHEDCIVEWLQDHDDCPLCRSDIVDKQETDAE